MITNRSMYIKSMLNERYEPIEQKPPKKNISKGLLVQYSQLFSKTQNNRLLKLTVHKKAKI